MTIFTIHTPETAPADSKPFLEGARKRFGFVPNLMGALAESPAVIEGYATIGGILDKADLTPTERQIIMLTASRYHECHYCMAAHSAIAAAQNVPAEVIEAIREDKPIPDAKLEALRVFTRTLVDKRGFADDAEVQAFISAGYSRAQALEVVLGIAMKTISNYINHLAETPVDEKFAGRAWPKAG